MFLSDDNTTYRMRYVTLCTSSGNCKYKDLPPSHAGGTHFPYLLQSLRAVHPLWLPLWPTSYIWHWHEDVWLTLIKKFLIHERRIGKFVLACCLKEIIRIWALKSSFLSANCTLNVGKIQFPVFKLNSWIFVPPQNASRRWQQLQAIVLVVLWTSWKLILWALCELFLINK